MLAGARSVGEDRLGLNLSYKGKGFETSDRRASSEELKNNDYQHRSYTFNSYRVSYLKKTFELAIRNKAKVIAVISPLPPSVFNGIEDYARISSEIRCICDAFGITLLDFNLINQQEHLFTDASFMDTHHLNQQGADLLSAYMIRYIKSSGSFTLRLHFSAERAEFADSGREFQNILCIFAFFAPWSEK